MTTVADHRASHRIDSASRQSAGGADPASCEHFIPLRKSELLEALAATSGLSPNEADCFRQLCRLHDGLVHRQYQHTLEGLKDAYAPFDPDADTRARTDLSDALREQRRASLFQQFGWLLERGNFVRLSQDAIDHAIDDCSHWGLNLAVDFEIFEKLEIYARGDTLGTRFRRRLRNRFRPEAFEVPMFQRLAVIFRLRPGRKTQLLDTDDVYIKLFKDVPKMDLDMLLPGTQVRMSLFDRGKILLPTVSGLAITLTKLFQGALIVAAAGAYGTLAFIGLVGGTVGYGARSFYGYLNTKQKYQLNLTQSLYYQNLDNNAGAIHRLLDEAEEQENREALLAYFHLWRHAPREGWTAAELDADIEKFLRDRVGREVDFEVADALAKLDALSIVEQTNQRFTAVPIERAIEALADRWQALPSA